MCAGLSSADVPTARPCLRVPSRPDRGGSASPPRRGHRESRTSSRFARLSPPIRPVATQPLPVPLASDDVPSLAFSVPPWRRPAPWAGSFARFRYLPSIPSTRASNCCRSIPFRPLSFSSVLVARSHVLVALHPAPLIPCHCRIRPVPSSRSPARRPHFSCRCRVLSCAAVTPCRVIAASRPARWCGRVICRHLAIPCRHPAVRPVAGTFRVVAGAVRCRHDRAEIPRRDTAPSRRGVPSGPLPGIPPMPSSRHPAVPSVIPPSRAGTGTVFVSLPSAVRCHHDTAP